MVPTEVTETSTLSIHTPGNYPKEENIRYSQHGESLKTRVETSHGSMVNILWNQHVQIDRTVPNNKPDIMIGENLKGTCMLIDVANTGERNVVKKEEVEILKYKDLIIEIKRTWDCSVQGLVAANYRSAVCP
jgi:hypothetical protein